MSSSNPFAEDLIAAPKKATELGALAKAKGWKQNQLDDIIQCDKIDDKVKDDFIKGFNGEEEIDTLVRSCWVDPNIVIPAPPVILKVGGIILATSGNISATIGKAKSKKSFLMSIMAAAAASNTEVTSVEGCLTSTKRKVVYFDTEQSNYHVAKQQVRILKLGAAKENLKVYRLREQNTSLRIDIIKRVITTSSDVGLFIIDGIRDLLVNGINDEANATEILDLLLHLSSKYNTHIMVVLHQNKTDANARGHIGTEILNKAETTISVTKDLQDDRISVVQAEYSRNKPFEAFAFQINEDGIPEVAAVPIKPGNGKTSIRPESFELKYHSQKLNGMFSISPELDASSLNDCLREEYHIGRDKSKEFIVFFEKKKLIRFKKVGKSKLYSFVNPENQLIAF